MPPAERLITVEEFFELGLDRDPERHPDVLALQARMENVEGQGRITVADLTRAALGMSPDRVIVGEVKGPEVIPMLNAMSQGNDGSMCTVHASSTRGALKRLASLALQSPERLPMDAGANLVADAVHFVVHLAFTKDKTRVVSSIREIVGCDGVNVVSNEIFTPGPDRRGVPGTQLTNDMLDELEAFGGLDVDAWLA